MDPPPLLFWIPICTNPRWDVLCNCHFNGRSLNASAVLSLFFHPRLNGSGASAHHTKKTYPVRIYGLLCHSFGSSSNRSSLLAPSNAALEASQVSLIWFSTTRIVSSAEAFVDRQVAATDSFVLERWSPRVSCISWRRSDSTSMNASVSRVLVE